MDPNDNPVVDQVTKVCELMHTSRTWNGSVVQNIAVATDVNHIYEFLYQGMALKTCYYDLIWMTGKSRYTQYIIGSGSHMMEGLLN